jgi:hypothetical protein
MEQGINNNVAQGKETERIMSPPYISFLTFTNFLMWLETEGVPLQFDSSFWRRKYSGSTGFQLMSGLRFLGLLKGDKPQPVLEKLVDAKGDARKETLRDVIRESYSKMDFDVLSRATPKMLEDQLREYGIEGDTLRKAESFFINACKFVDITLSSTLKKKARNKPAKSAAGGTRTKGRKKESHAGQQPEDQDKRRGPTGEGQVSKIALASGGDVTLTVNVDLFLLSKEDREFVLNLVDMMRGYEK